MIEVTDGNYDEVTFGKALDAYLTEASTDDTYYWAEYSLEELHVEIEKRETEFKFLSSDKYGEYGEQFAKDYMEYLKEQFSYDKTDWDSADEYLVELLICVEDFSYKEKSKITTIGNYIVNFVEIYWEDNNDAMRMKDFLLSHIKDPIDVYCNNLCRIFQDLVHMIPASENKNEIADFIARYDEGMWTHYLKK